MTDQEIRDKIRIKRLEIRLSQRDLAAKTGLSENTVVRAERNPERVNFQSILKITRVLGIDIRFE